MKTSAGFWLLAVLLLAATSFSQDQAVKYFKAGDALQLSPQRVSAEIYSIVWKYDKNLLAEWVKGSVPLTYYSKFKGRTTLNTTTGVLEIRGLTVADSGVYSLEINNQVQSQVYQIVEIKAVPQPVVKVTPLVCNSTSESCKLVCEGDVSKAGPVEYLWKKDDGEWEQSGKKMEILNNEETQSVKTFSCRMKNLVSESDSEPIDNPLYQEKNPDCGLCVTLSGAVMRSLAVLAPFWAAVCLWTKRKTLCKCRNTQKLKLNHSLNFLV